MTRTAKMRLQRQAGVGLIELMISLLISAVILAAVLNFYLAASRSSGATLKASKLNQELLALATVMSSEIRRAGYTADTGIVLDPTINAFNEVDVTTLTVRTSKASPLTTPADPNDPGECILFAYDRDEDTVLDPNELLGFRLDNGVIQMRISGDTTAARHDSCNHAHADEQWLDLTDGRLITITKLDIDSAGSSCINTREPDGVDSDGDGAIDNTEEADCYNASNTPTAGSGDKTVETREISISIDGQLNNDASTTASASQVVVVRNDLVRER